MEQTHSAFPPIGNKTTSSSPQPGYHGQDSQQEDNAVNTTPATPTPTPTPQIGSVLGKICPPPGNTIADNIIGSWGDIEPNFQQQQQQQQRRHQQGSRILQIPQLGAAEVPRREGVSLPPSSSSSSSSSASVEADNPYHSSLGPGRPASEREVVVINISNRPSTTTTTTTTTTTITAPTPTTPASAPPKGRQSHKGSSSSHRSSHRPHRHHHKHNNGDAESPPADPDPYTLYHYPQPSTSTSTSTATAASPQGYNTFAHPPRTDKPAKANMGAYPERQSSEPETSERTGLLHASGNFYPPGYDVERSDSDSPMGWPKEDQQPRKKKKMGELKKATLVCLAFLAFLSALLVSFRMSRWTRHGDLSPLPPNEPFHPNPPIDDVPDGDVPRDSHGNPISVLPPVESCRPGLDFVVPTHGYTIDFSPSKNVSFAEMVRRVSGGDEGMGEKEKRKMMELGVYGWFAVRELPAGTSDGRGLITVDITSNVPFLSDQLSFSFSGGDEQRVVLEVPHSLLWSTEERDGRPCAVVHATLFVPPLPSPPSPPGASSAASSSSSSNSSRSSSVAVEATEAAVAAAVGEAAAAATIANLEANVVHLSILLSKSIALQVIGAVRLSSIIGDVRATVDDDSISVSVPINHSLSSTTSFTDENHEDDEDGDDISRGGLNTPDSATITTITGSITGPWTLGHHLTLSTIHGDISVAVLPLDLPDPAALVAGSISGDIDIQEAGVPGNQEHGIDDIPQRDYSNTVTSTSGDIDISVAFRSAVRVESVSGNIRGVFLPVVDSSHKEEGEGGGGGRRMKLETHVKSGDVDVTVLEPLIYQTATTAKDGNFTSRRPKTPVTAAEDLALGFRALTSAHEVVSGNLDLKYPASWEGFVHVESTLGEAEVEGKDVMITKRSRIAPGFGRVVEGLAGELDGDGEGSRAWARVVRGDVGFCVGGC